MDTSLITALALLGLTVGSVQAQTPAPSPAPAAAPRRLPADSIEIARRYATWFLTYQADSLFAHLPAEDRQQAGSVADMNSQMMQFAARVRLHGRFTMPPWPPRGSMLGV